MAVLSTVNRLTEPLRPSDGVVVAANFGNMESGNEGFVRKEKPTNGDDVLVRITKSRIPALVGKSLSYKRSSLVLIRRNGK
jgi:hypothetical protein